jgi:ABC-type Fe3+/spermidine/putrescine transport system ATPase subunit
VTVVDGVSLTIGHGELFALLGPSGCGKTTLLRMIGGLEAPSAGTIVLDGADVTRTPPHLRPVNMVFQQYALFPHLNVADNVAFGLRYKGLPRRAWAAKVAAALALVRLDGFERRRPDELSGGQRQRVALARALVLEPKVLLLDEPLGALDQKLRKEVQVELKTLQRTLGITFVFVTHDQEEALALSDRMAVMSQGRVAQVGKPAEIFERPETEGVAEFMGAANFFTAEAREAGPGRLELRLAAGATFTMPKQDPSRGLLEPGERVRFIVRPEKLTLHATPPQPPFAAVPVTVEDRVYQGVSTLWLARGPGGERFTVCGPSDAPAAANGAAAFLCWDPIHTVIVR